MFSFELLFLFWICKRKLFDCDKFCLLWTDFQNILTCKGLKFAVKIRRLLKTALSQDDSSTIPVDIGVAPFSPNHWVDGNDMLIVRTAIHTALPSSNEFAGLNGQDNVVCLSCKFVIIDEIEGSRVLCDCSGSQAKVGGEKYTVMTLWTDNPNR